MRMRLPQLAAARRDLPARRDERVTSGAGEGRRPAHLRGVRLHQVLRSRSRCLQGGVDRPLVRMLMSASGPLQTSREPYRPRIHLGRAISSLVVIDMHVSK